MTGGDASRRMSTMNGVERSTVSWLELEDARKVGAGQAYFAQLALQMKSDLVWMSSYYEWKENKQKVAELGPLPPFWVVEVVEK